MAAYPFRVAIGALAALIAAGAAHAWTPSPAAEVRLQAGGVVAEVAKGPVAASGVIHGAIDIRAPASAIWAVMLDCAKATRMVSFVKSCRVVQKDPAGLWDVREHHLDYGFPFPRIRSVFRSRYEPGRRVTFRCLPEGDLKSCEGEWRLEPLPDGAVRVIYENRIVSPFSAPSFMIRGAFRSDVTKALRGLKRESLAAAAK